VTRVHLVVPAGFDDPARPSGGNAYDSRIRAGLTQLGWSVQVLAVPGSWPRPDRAAAAALASALAGVPDTGTVLIDGLIASALPQVVVPECGRLRVAVLVHMPLSESHADRGAFAVRAKERAVLSAAAAVVTTSRWTRSVLLGRYGLLPARVHVAAPGAEAATSTPATPAGGELLCVAAVAPHKGQDVLLGALALLTELSWRCTLVGPLDRDPAFVQCLCRQAQAARIDHRLRVTGALSGGELERAYAGADLLVLPSHAETYGMVVTEALARGLPVLATWVGGVPEALGRTPDGGLPGLLVPPGDAAALAAALRGWLTEPVLRSPLRSAAAERRSTLPGWPATALAVSAVLAEVAP